jgi:hypothetical protein
MSQCSKIEAILLRDGIISNFYAINSKLSYRLGARIDDLKKKGWEFQTFFGDGPDEKNYYYKVTKVPELKQESLI